LIIRGKDGVVRAFHNVCSHRGNKLVANEKGTCPGAIHCPFHSWLYSDEGDLIRVPDEENFFDLDKTKLGLTPVNMDIWEGFIFINLDADPKQTLREYLGGVADQLEGCPFGEASLAQTYKVDERANWKVGLDAQNEIYHLPYQHARLIGKTFLMNDKHNCRFQEVILYERHSLWASELTENPPLTPLEKVLGRLDQGGKSFRMPQMISQFDFYVIFPNMVIILFRGPAEDGYITYNFWPLAVDRTVWEIRSYSPPARTVGQRLGQEYFKCLIRDALQEDSVAHEGLQTGLTSRAKTHFVYQDEEIQIRHFHNVLESYMGYFNGAGTDNE
jgi:phenylpropionate dioxygenase-like ring-hydroxylating dioxygenase large terminal subunit